MTLVFPPDDGPLDPEYWWAPLEAVARVIAHGHRYRFFDLADFMVMARHGHTRRYLNLDPAGHAYRYSPPCRGSGGSGSYLRHRSLRDALDALDPWELPWMKTSLEAHRCGLTWEERWELCPDDDEWTLAREEGQSRGHLRVV